MSDSNKVALVHAVNNKVTGEGIHIKDRGFLLIKGKRDKDLCNEVADKLNSHQSLVDQNEKLREALKLNMKALEFYYEFYREVRGREGEVKHSAHAIGQSALDSI